MIGYTSPDVAMAEVDGAIEAGAGAGAGANAGISTTYATGRSLSDAATWGGSEAAAAQYRACEAAGGVVLNVPRCELTSLPVELGQLRALKVFICHNNQLTSLPVELGKLQALTHFVCYKNQLTSLPVELGQLRALMEFNCHTNQLTSLPVELGQLTAGCNFDDNPLSEGEPTIIEELRARWESRVHTKAVRVQ